MKKNPCWLHLVLLPIKTKNVPIKIDSGSTVSEEAAGEKNNDRTLGIATYLDIDIGRNALSAGRNLKRDQIVDA